MAPTSTLVHFLVRADPLTVEPCLGLGSLHSTDTLLGTQSRGSRVHLARSLCRWSGEPRGGRSAPRAPPCAGLLSHPQPSAKQPQNRARGECCPAKGGTTSPRGLGQRQDLICIACAWCSNMLHVCLTCVYKCSRQYHTVVCSLCDVCLVYVSSTSDRCIISVS